MNLYFGDIPICYSDSLAMVLHSYGYDFSPEFLEALMVMGNGASFVKEDVRHPLVFFDNNMPDLAIGHCLRMLGFDYEEFFNQSSDLAEVEELFGKLRSYLEQGSVLVGPLDMGYLTYNSHHAQLKGVDHFVSVFDMDEESIYFHDPAGYPCMKMPLADFLLAWKAEAIAYKRGSYSMWGNLKRKKMPTMREIYHEVSGIMKAGYESGEAHVIEKYAQAIRANGLNPEQKQLHQFFSFRLAAARSLYTSQFLKEFDLERASLKEELAILFGQAYLDSLKDDNEALADTLMAIAELDEQFKELCILYRSPK